MRKVIGVAGALAVALVATGAALAWQAKTVCPGTREPGEYCEKCAALVEKKDIKNGKCAKDQSTLLKVQVCVKKHYLCGCGKGNCCSDDKEKPGSCKCGKPLKEDANKSLVTYTCATCGASSPVKDKVMHKDDCKKKDVKMACGH